MTTTFAHPHTLGVKNICLYKLMGWDLKSNIFALKNILKLQIKVPSDGFKIIIKNCVDS